MKSTRHHGVAQLFKVVVLLGGALQLGSAAAQLVDVSNTPLYGGRQPHPNVAVTTSVEFPTVGAAYLGVGYSKTTAYLGYFDPTKCYQYSTAGVGYFYVVSAASTVHECAAGTAFSGSFMNWATMSAIDEFRYAMTGGNRINENGPNGGTILQRAYLPDGTVPGVPNDTPDGIGFYGFASNFPRHSTVNGQVDGNTSSLTSAILPAPTSFNSTSIFITSCGTKVFFGSQADGTCTNPRADYGNYNVNINVCDAAEGPSRADLCLQYGIGGKYKPVGQVQVNAGRMRFAAFGYLLDRNVTGYTIPSGCANDSSNWNRCRYGGVLRSPMKYVGPTQYDGNLNASPNLKNEVNADGTLNPDPEGTASTAGGSNSGFISYINKFGQDGAYKKFDPMGEMFYEAIRYFQGLQPTPQAYSGTYPNSVKGNFPLLTTWTDPILSRCSSNFIINLSDANTWDDTYLPGFNYQSGNGFGRPGARPAIAGLDAWAFTQKIGILENQTPSITSGDVDPGLLNIANMNTGNSYSTWLAAGAAFWANTQDIRPDLVGKQTIKTISFDVAEASIDIRDRQLYLMGKYGGFYNTIDRSTDGTQANPFYGVNPGLPAGPAIRTNSEWEDSLGSAYPANYVLASDPTKLINGIRAAFVRIAAQTGTLSGASLTSANLSLGSAGAYIATFDPAKWAGSVLYNTLSVDPVTGALQVSANPIWDAGSLLTARCGAPTSGSTVCTDTSTSPQKRNIFTTKRSGGTRVATPFTYAGISSDPAYLAALNIDPITLTADGEAQQRINYLRGYRADETTSLNYRDRDSAFGDVINSGPVYIGAPAANIPDASYQAFFAANVNRQGTVYVGANDGMMHALNSTTGQEMFAYVPNFISTDLNDLTNPSYVHETFVDTVPVVRDLNLGSTAAPNWTSVLIGSSGGGAQGLFALDVTSPTSFSAANVLWEFTDADDVDFFNVLTAVEVAKLKVGGTAAAPVYRNFVIATGYNNRRTAMNAAPGTDTRVSSDTTNKGVLFMIAADHVLGTAWVLGSDYYKFTFPATNPSQANGLGPVTLLPSKSGDGSTAGMYFGDLQGNLWRLNTTGIGASTWVPARGTALAPQPIFVAQSSAGVRQPITARVEVGSGPFGGTLVTFGTGVYLGLTDLYLPAAQQSEYAFLDLAGSTIVTRSTDLVGRTGTLSGGVVSIAGPVFSYSGPSAKLGWYLDFPSSTSIGERSITKPALKEGLITFSTLTLAPDICGGGSGYIYQLNALTGLSFAGNPGTGGYVSTVGIPGPPVIVTLASTAGQTQPTGEVLDTNKSAVLVSGTLGKIDTPGDSLTRKTPPHGRISWREITNWNDRTGH